MKHKKVGIENKEGCKGPGVDQRPTCVGYRVFHMGGRVNGLLVLFVSTAFALGVLFGAPVAHAAATLNAPPNDLGLAGWWTFNSNDVTGTSVLDMSGNNETGTTFSSPKGVPGVLGQALSFNGTSQLVQYSYVPQDGTTTFAAWIKPNTTSGYQNIVGMTSWWTASYGYGMIIDNGYLVGLAANNNGGWDANLRTPITPGVWSYVVFTLNGWGAGATGKLYVNGVLKSTYVGNASNYSYAFSIGGVNDTAYGAGRLGFFFGGDIDNVRMYNRVLSAAEIQHNYDIYKLGITSPTVSGASPTRLLTNGLVGYWTFDGANTNWTANTTADVSGKGYTGTMVGMSPATSAVLGRFGQALNFNGTGYVAINNSASSFNFGTGNFSVSIWFKEPFGASPSYLFSKYYDNNYWDYDFGIGTINNWCSPGTISLGFTMNLVNGGCIKENVWHHVVGVRNGAVLQLYLDGKPVGSHAIATSTSYDNPGIVEIGGHTFANPFPGIIDDVRVYDRALSQTEVTQLYNAGAVGTTIDTAPAQALSGGGLVGYWPFDGNKMNWASNQALDASGNGNNGTLVNMTPANAVMGKIGQALSFGSSQWVSIPYNPALDWGASGGSVVAWVRFTQNEQQYSRIFDKTSCCGNGYALMTSGNDPKFSVKNISGTSVNIQSNTPLTIGKWYQMVGVYNGTNALLYVNGQLVASAPLTGAVDTGSGNVEGIGWKNSGQSSEKFYGDIDQVRVYNRPLSASEVKQLYNLGR